MEILCARAVKWTVSSASDCSVVKDGIPGVRGETGEPVRGRREKLRSTRPDGLDVGKWCMSGL